VRTEAAGEVTILIDRSLDLDCAYGQSGRDALRERAAVADPRVVQEGLEPVGAFERRERAVGGG